jgi:hypothetical protein
MAETAVLTPGDVTTLNELFWDSPLSVRFVASGAPAWFTDLRSTVVGRFWSAPGPKPQVNTLNTSENRE